MTKTHMGLLAALVISLGANGYLLFRGAQRSTEPEDDPESAEAHPAGAIPDPDEPGATAGAADPPAGEAEPQRPPDEWMGELGAGEMGSAAGQHELSSRVDEDLSQELLCQVARSRLRSEWEDERDTNLANLRQSLGDEEEQARNTEEQLDRMVGVLGLSQDDRSRLEGRYGPLRRSLTQQAERLLSEEPANWQGVYELARILFRDEDRLVQEVAGEQGLVRFRATRAEGRITVLALLATYAGVSWDEAIVH